MNYRVVWRRSLRQRLDILGFLARERGDHTDRIQKAIDEIEGRLAFDPHTQGESRDAGERVLVVSPLTVRYEVFEDAQVVLIYSCRHFHRPY